VLPSQTEREREREREKERVRKRERERDVEFGCFIFMTGALAPFSYLVNNIIIIIESKKLLELNQV